MRYEVKIGSIEHLGWGFYDAVSPEKLVKTVKTQIENLNPINSSPEGAEAYRNRFRNKPILLRLHGEKTFTEYN